MSCAVLSTSDAEQSSHCMGTGVGHGIISKRRRDRSVKSTTDLCEDGPESNDAAEKVNARISVNGAGDCNKNKYQTAKNTVVATSQCSETTPIACIDTAWR